MTSIPATRMMTVLQTAMKTTSVVGVIMKKNYAATHGELFIIWGPLLASLKIHVF